MIIEVIDPSNLDWTPELEEITLFIEPHSHFPIHFKVNCFSEERLNTLRNLIGDDNTIPAVELEDLYLLARENGFENIWHISDPNSILERVSGLKDPYPYDLNIQLKSFQLQGFNYTKDLIADIINWSAGTGKSVFAVARAKYLLKMGLVNKVVVVSRNHNKINWLRQFKKIGNLDAVVIDSTSKDALEKRKERIELYLSSQIFVINYEKLRLRGHNAFGGDGEELSEILKGEKVYFIFDEMPMMLKNRKSQTYLGTRKCLKAAKTAYRTMLSATPLENSPEDVYSSVKLLDPKIFTTVSKFRDDYALTRNPFAPWQVTSWNQKSLPEIGMRLAHITHRADKYNDPKIRDQFPKEHWEDIIVDMSRQDRRIYNFVLNRVRSVFWDEKDKLSLALVLQLVCDNPKLLIDSTADLALLASTQPFYTGEKYCAKLQVLRELLDQIDGKIVLFNMYNNLGSKMLQQTIQNWGFNSILYEGTSIQKQKVEDDFRHNEDIKIFVSSDQGSDSINLERATSVINYNLPWKWTTLVQRVNRINRLTSEADHIFYYNLLNANSIEDRKVEVLQRKRNFQDLIFDEITESHELGNIVPELWYIITGEKEKDLDTSG